MKSDEVQCLCGAAVLKITGEPMVQAYCHCDDCQAAHGAAYIATAAYPSEAVEIEKGELSLLIVKTALRMRCTNCGTFLFTEVTGANLRSVNATLLPKGRFKPQFHLQCQHAVLPIVDSLPHYKDFPAAFGGTDELVQW